MHAAAVALQSTDVQMRAFQLFQERVRKGLQGDPQSDWLEAERQLQRENSIRHEATVWATGTTG